MYQTNRMKSIQHGDLHHTQNDRSPRMTIDAILKKQNSGRDERYQKLRRNTRRGERCLFQASQLVKRSWSTIKLNKPETEKKWELITFHSNIHCECIRAFQQSKINTILCEMKVEMNNQSNENSQTNQFSLLFMDPCFSTKNTTHCIV